jgi:hypothetical protein
MTDNGYRTRKLDIIVDSPRHCSEDCIGFYDLDKFACPVCKLEDKSLRLDLTLPRTLYLRTDKCKRTARKA